MSEKPKRGRKSKRKLENNQNRDADPKLVELWERALDFCKQDYQATSDNDLASLLQQLEKSLHGVRKEVDAHFLLRKHLPTFSQFLMDTHFNAELHRLANHFIRTTLAFCIAAVEMDPIEFGKESCQLMTQIFRHKFFHALAAELSSPSSQPSSSSSSSVASTGRQSLTLSTKHRTLSRLSEVLSLFTQAHGYQTIVDALTNGYLTDLSLVYHYVDVICAMSTYTGIAFLKQHLPQFFSLVYRKLLESVPFCTDIDLHYFEKIREMLVTLAREIDTQLMEATYTFTVECTIKLLKELPTSISILFLHWPAREKQMHSIDIRNLSTVADVKRILAENIGIRASDIVLVTISHGRITTVHSDNSHVLHLTTGPGEAVVGYHLPLQGKPCALLQICQTKPIGEQYVPFFVIFPGDSVTVSPMQLYECVGGAYIFSTQTVTKHPFEIKLWLGEATHKVPFNATKVMYTLQQAPTAGELTFQDLQANVAQVEWSAQTSFEELQGYDIATLSKQNKLVSRVMSELAAFCTKDEFVSFISTLKPNTDKQLLRDFVQLLVEVFCGSTNSELQIQLAKVLKTIYQHCDRAFFNKILKRNISNLENRCMQLLQSPRQTVRTEVAWSACELAYLCSKYNDAPLLDVLPYSPNEWLAENSQHTVNTTPVDVLSPELQFLFKLGFFRTIDIEFLQQTPNPSELFWYLPFVLRLLSEDAIESQTNRSTNCKLVAAIAALLRNNQFLAQFAYWLRETGIFIDNSIEWAYSPRLDASLSFFKKLATTTVEKGLIFENLNILNPLFAQPNGANGIVKTATVKKIFASKAKPFLLELESDGSGNPRSTLVIFKKGDDLRADMLVQTMLYLFNALWKNSYLSMTPFAFQYKVLPMGPDIGCVEFVTESESLQKFDFATSWKSLTPEQRRIFICSAAGGFVSGWVLGIRDRHQDNMMIKQGHIFYQIDFGHLFNSRPAIDAPRFAIPPEWKATMTQEEWNTFKDTCAEAFRVLHRNASLIINFTCLLFSSLPSIDLATLRNFLASPSSLMVSLTEKDACEKIRNLIEVRLYAYSLTKKSFNDSEQIQSGVVSIKRALKDNIHTMFISGAN